MTMRMRKAENLLKMALLSGRPLAVVGLILAGVGFANGSDIAIGSGCLMLFAGVISAWTGKIGLFWIR